MSRTRKAGIIAVFGYVQFGLAFVAGIVLLPLILREVGTQTYGWWLACGELLAYSAMVDLGVLGVLPWVIAQKDGGQDRKAIRSLISNGMLLATLVGIVYALVALALWFFASKITGLGAEQREVLQTPLLIVIAGTALSFPMRTFFTVLQGLQDVAFLGVAGIVQWSLNVGIALALLLSGYGLYALALSIAVPPLVHSVLCLIRLRLIAPDVLRGWPMPDLAHIFTLSRDGLGVWMGGIGWRMAAASNSIIIASVIDPVSAVVYACTIKMGEILMQMAWQLSDSGLIGLAQLSGEGDGRRVRRVVLSMLRLLSITAGGVAYLMLLFNPGFVRLWVGADKFGGYVLNMLMAANVISISFAHGLFVTASVLGKRFEAGLATLLQGVFHIAAALTLGYYFGLKGVAVASLLSSTLVAIPLGKRYLGQITRLTTVDLWQETFAPWGTRVILLLIASACLGLWMTPDTLWLLLMLGPLFGLLYVWYMRPLYADLPLPHRAKPWLIRMRLLPNAKP